MSGSDVWNKLLHRSVDNKGIIMTTRDKVLAKLEMQKGAYISGEHLAADLGVSRNAIWKAINDLRSSGYNITSASNRGYMLDSSSDVISPQGIQIYLNNPKDADRIQVFDCIESTNLEARRQVIEGYHSGDIIIARTQTAGRGHLNKMIDSPESGIYLSQIIEPTDRDIPNKSIHATVRISKAIEKVTGKQVEIGWTSNIFLDGKKVAGILNEVIADLETGIISKYICGVGIMLPGYSRNQLIAEIINEYNTRVSKKDISFYNDRLRQVGEKVTIVLPEPDGGANTVIGKVIGLDLDGCLQLENDKGKVIVIRRGYIAE